MNDLLGIENVVDSVAIAYNEPHKLTSHIAVKKTDFHSHIVNLKPNFNSENSLYFFTF